MLKNDYMLERYVRDISAYPLISAQREKELANIIHSPSSSEKEKARAKNELVLGNLRIVVKIALAMYKKVAIFSDINLSVMDLIQAGNIGIMDAANFFISEKKCKFSTYAYRIIERRIMLAVKESRFIRLPVNQYKRMHEIDELKEKYKGISDITIAHKLNILESTIEGIKRNRYGRVSDEDAEKILENINANEIAPDKALSNKQLVGYLFKKAKGLSPRQRDAILYRYFSNKEMRLEDIAIKMGISKERVRQILLVALRVLRTRISEETIRRRKNENKK
jgi:RNA polymerase primary sigma factor